jgi:hypothetical protein
MDGSVTLRYKVTVQLVDELSSAAGNRQLMCRSRGGFGWLSFLAGTSERE